jgi:ATP-binding cassette subfamily C (CFTR/MRP) protein 1
MSDRLNTILDSDRILVLSNGTVAEFDTPAELLARSQSIFRSLVAEAGLTESSETKSQ